MVFIKGLLGVKGKKIKKIGNNKGKKGCNRSKIKTCQRGGKISFFEVGNIALRPKYRPMLKLFYSCCAITL
jgi:hypothetical protein